MTSIPPVTSSSVKAGRRDDLDVVKAILILTVVATHSRLGVDQVFNWFHMADFFILSGWFFRPASGEGAAGFTATALRTLKHYLIPFFIWKIIIYSASIALIADKRRELSTWSNFVDCLLGRPMQGGDFFIVFWFIPVLCLVQIAVTGLLCGCGERKALQISTLLMFFCAGITLFARISGRSLDLGFPVRWDVVAAGIFFFHVCGSWLFKRHERVLLQPFVLFCLAAGLSLILAAHVSKRAPHLFAFADMGSSGNILYDIFIPIAALALLIRLASLFAWLPAAARTFVSFMGKNTLVIMYTHVCCGRLAKLIYEQINPPLPRTLGFLLYAVAGGLLIPLLIAWIIRRSRPLSRFLLGETPRKTANAGMLPSVT